MDMKTIEYLRRLKPSFFELSDLQDFLESQINKKVDILFTHKIFPELRDSILREAIDV